MFKANLKIPSKLKAKVAVVQSKRKPYEMTQHSKKNNYIPPLLTWRIRDVMMRPNIKL